MKKTKKSTICGRQVFIKGVYYTSKVCAADEKQRGNLRWRRPKKNGSRMAFRRKERAQWQRADPDTPETTAIRKRTSTSSSTEILTTASTPRESAVAEIRTTPPARPGAACLTTTDGNIIAGLHVKFNYPSRPCGARKNYKAPHGTGCNFWNHKGGGRLIRKAHTRYN